MSVGAGTPGSDVVGTPFDVEVKATKSWSPKTWLDQSRARTQESGQIGFCVIRLTGQGEEKAHEYAALLPLETLVDLLRFKYNHLDHNPRDEDLKRCTVCGSWLITACLTCARGGTHA